MAVKGERGSPVSAANHCQCADMIALQMNSAPVCGAAFAFANCIFITRALQELRGSRVLQGHRVAKETR